MKEMVGGCCVCSDERGWPDNPLVYCDGNGCTVAVHQACYGIVTVPLGPWYCRKCESSDRAAKVRCELCPSRSGALKRVETGGWAHVVCALYIPEVRFGNVTSMEPIMLQCIPSHRYNWTCYICQDQGKHNRSQIGACMQCNKSGCKQQFHVTCAQGLGLLCEEAGNYLDNVKYCGYCQHHYSKLKKGGNVKTIPPYKPISQDSHSSDSSPEKEGEASTSGINLLPSSSSSVTTTPLPNTTPSTSAPSKTLPNKSSSGRKSSSSSGQQTSGGNIKLPHVTVRLPTITTSTITSAIASATNSGSKIVANDAVASTSKTSIAAAVEKISSKRWSTTPSPSQEVSLLNSSSSSSGSLSNSRIIELSPSSESSTGPPKNNVIMPKGKMQKGATGKGSKSAGVISNASPNAGSNAGSVITTPPLQHQSEQYTAAAAENKEKLDANSYAVSSDIKQTKKKKAISQSAAQDLSVHSGETRISSSALNDRAYNGADRAPDSTNDDKNKKALKNEMINGTGKTAATGSQPSNYTGGLNIQMEPNLAAPHSSHASSSLGYPGATTSSSAASSSSQQNQSYHLEQRALPSHSIVNPSHPNESSMGHIQSYSKYSKDSHMGPGESHPSEIPSSVMVSVQLPQSGQGLNLSAHQNSSAIDLVSSQSMSPQPSASNWGLKVAYEPQIPHHGGAPKMSEVDMLYSMPKRSRIEGADKANNAKQPGNNTILIDSIDKMASIATGGARNKKRAAMTAAMMAMQPNNLMAAANFSNIQNFANKRIKQGTPPPSTSTSYPDMHSPPRSPGREIKTMKSNIQRSLGRAPHMLGNELNPDSAAAARLSENLSAELAAHSVFRAPSPLVPPPLINRATVSERMGLASKAPLGLGSGGAQSLDQLLERQWEQGSQFLMEQAQHFDIASLLSCLHQLRNENINLEEYMANLNERKDHLLAVNARLANPLNSVQSSGDPRPRRDANPSMQQRQIQAERNQQMMMSEMQPKPS